MKRLLPLLLVCAVLLPLCALGETVPAFADEGVRSAVCLHLGLDDASELTAAALSSLTEPKRASIRWPTFPCCRTCKS